MVLGDDRRSYGSMLAYNHNDSGSEHTYRSTGQYLHRRACRATEGKNPNNSNRQNSPPEPRTHPPAPRSSHRYSRSSLAAGDSAAAAAADSTCPAAAAAAGNRAAGYPAVDRVAAAGTVRYTHQRSDGRQEGKSAVGRHFALVLLSSGHGPCAD